MQKNCLSYPVEFIDDAFGESPALANLLKAVTGQESPEVFLVADLNVVQRTEGLGAKIGRYVQAHGIRLVGSPVVISGGEKIKTDALQSALKIVDALLASRLDREGVVLAIGGGTLLDVAGYAAAQVRGGRRIVRLPTTPAAMIDAAFAESAVVNLGSVKNALCVASVPAAVVIEPKFAMSVLDGVWRSGFGEAVRLAAVRDAALVKKLAGWAEGYRARDLETLKALVAATQAVRAKKGDSSFATWAALRFEAMSGYKLPHGYAVTIGISIDLAYAEMKGLLKSEARATLMNLLEGCGVQDSIAHSRHLLQQEDELLRGLDAWRLQTGAGDLMLPSALGKGCLVSDIDREAYRQVFKSLIPGRFS